MAMFAPLTRPGLGAASPGARLYCRPVCFVDRPHELDDAGLRIADTMLWFAAWHLSLRDGDAVRSAIVPVPELDDWIAALPDRHAEAARAQRAAVARPRGVLQLGERPVRPTAPQLLAHGRTSCRERVCKYV